MLEETAQIVSNQRDTDLYFRLVIRAPRIGLVESGTRESIVFCRGLMDVGRGQAADVSEFRFDAHAHLMRYLDNLFDFSHVLVVGK